MRLTPLFLLLLTLISCQEPGFKKEWTTEQAPETFTARFETSKGSFELTITRSWSPKAADRLYQLVNHHYYDNAVFYRVVPQFVAQFGNTNTTTMAQWRTVPVPDEPRLHSNTRGTVSFARSGKDSRDLEVFINLQNNTELDTIQFEGVTGFTPIGTVTKGMENVDRLYSGYAETPMADPALYQSRTIFMQNYSKLDGITKAYLVED